MLLILLDYYLNCTKPIVVLVWYLIFFQQELRERIKPYFLRRKKSEVSLETTLTDDKQLPKKNELIIWLKLTDCQVLI
jgi:hypothetical protein